MKPQRINWKVAAIAGASAGMVGAGGFVLADEATGTDDTDTDTTTTTQPVSVEPARPSAPVIVESATETSSTTSVVADVTSVESVESVESSNQHRSCPSNRSNRQHRSCRSNRSSPHHRSRPSNRSSPHHRSRPSNRSSPHHRSRPSHRSRRWGPATDAPPSVGGLVAAPADQPFTSGTRSIVGSYIDCSEARATNRSPATTISKLPPCTRSPDTPSACST